MQRRFFWQAAVFLLLLVAHVTRAAPAGNHPNWNNALFFGQDRSSPYLPPQGQRDAGITSRYHPYSQIDSSTSQSTELAGSSAKQGPEIDEADVWTPEKLEKVKEANRRAKFEEPQFLKNIEFTVPGVQANRQIGPVNFVEAGDEDRKMINAQVFDGKLTWVKEQDMPDESWHGHRIAATRPSRVLPFVQVPSPRGAEGGTRNVRITVHGGPRGGDRWRRHHILNGKTFYRFWAIPEGRAPPGKKTLIKKIGVGFIEKGEHNHVDQYLQTMREREGIISEEAQRVAH